MAATGSVNRFERHPVAWAAVIVVAGALIIDLAAGLSATRAKRLAETAERTLRRPSALYHHDLAPMVDVDHVRWGRRTYRVITNSLGFRDYTMRTIPAAAPDSEYRVLLIGDSFAEGIGEPFDSTFAGILARELRPRRVDVLDAGVASYSPIIYWKKIEQLLSRGIRFDAVIVFIDISDIQDETVYWLDATGDVRATGSGGWLILNAPRHGWRRVAAWWADRSLLLGPLLRRLTLPSHGSAEARTCIIDGVDAGTGCRAGWTQSDSVLRAWGNAGLANAARHMSALATLLRKQGISTTIVVYPWPQQLRWNDRDSRQSRFWRAWAEKEHANFADLFPVFFKQVDSFGLNSAVSGLYINGDEHWNGRGHALVAGALLSSLCGAGPPWIVERRVTRICSSR